MRWPSSWGLRSLDQEVQAHAVDQLHDQKLLFVGCQSMFKSLHDVAVPHGHADDALGRTFEPRKACLEFESFFPVENLEANGPTGFAIARTPDLGHASLARAAQQLEAFIDVDDGKAIDRLGKQLF